MEKTAVYMGAHKKMGARILSAFTLLIILTTLISAPVSARCVVADLNSGNVSYPLNADISSYSSPASPNNTVTLIYNEGNTRIVVDGDDADKVLQYELLKYVDMGRMTGLSYAEISQIALLSQRYSHVSYSDGWIGDDNEAINCTDIKNRVVAGGPTGEPGGAAGVPSAPEASTQVTAGGAETLGEEKGEPAEKQEESPLIQYLHIITIGIVVLVVVFVIYQIYRTTAERGNTKVQLMEELSDADKIPTYLSSKTGLSKSTVIGHLQNMERDGIVEKVKEEGKKFVYYRLTRKGKEMLRNKGG